MTVPLAKVKSLCSDPEVNLVKASRRPELGKLTVAQTRRNIDRAKKYVDKWRDLKRGQSRARSDEVGFPDLDTRSKTKVEIFEDAMKSFEEHLAKLEAAGAEPAPKARKTQPKPARNATHRSSRAEVRQQLAEKEEKLNQKKAAPKKKSAPKKKAAPKASAKSEFAKKAAKRKQAKTAGKVKSAVEKQLGAGASTEVSGTPTGSVGLNPTKKNQRKAQTAAKQARITESGLTTRTRGHVSARTKRSAGRRDGRG